MGKFRCTYLPYHLPYQRVGTKISLHFWMIESMFKNKKK